MIIYMEVKDKKLKFGLKRSAPDDRDNVFSFFEYEKVPLPLRFSLSDTKEIKVFNQMNLNSCSANSVANQILLSNEKIKEAPSRLFLYWNSRREDIEEDHHSMFIEDSGASLRNTYKALMKFNDLPEQYYDYNESKVNALPPYDVYKTAARMERCMVSYRKIIPNEYNLNFILYKIQRPIVIGMCVFSNFELLSKDNYVLERPKWHNQMLGMHAVLCIGYDSIDETFIILNSHGKEFAKNGTFKIKNDYMLDPNLVFECWAINC